MSTFPIFLFKMMVFSGCRYDSSGRAPALQAQSSEFKPKYFRERYFPFA
jgi:hypothetical protein